MNAVKLPSSRPSRAFFQNLRVVGVAIAVLAALIYVNVAQLDRESESVLHSSGVLKTDVARVLAQRQTEAASNSLCEYGALTVAALGMTLALAGGKLRRPFRRRVAIRVAPTLRLR